MQEIYKNIYKKVIDLPNTPLRTLNLHIIHSQGETLVIDTGFRTEECLHAFKSSLDELGLSLKNTRLFVTHGHADHCGLCGILKDDLKEILMGANEAREMSKMAKVPDRMPNMFETVDLSRFFSETDQINDKFQFFMDFPYTPVNEGNLIKVGEYCFTAVETPGHTPGHMCLYEAEHKIMFTGDHVLGRISPNIAFWGYEYGDILNTFFESLIKVKSFDVKHPFGAHREFSGTLNQRIDELLLHHKERLDEIIELLTDQWQSVTDIASRMSWAIRVQGGWDNFPREQKVFASLECMSHLVHLVQIKKASMAEFKGSSYFTKL